MVQTISSIFFYVYYPLLINPNYLPLNQPLTAKDPIRRFEVYIDLSTLEYIYSILKIGNITIYRDHQKPFCKLIINKPDLKDF